VLALLLVWGVVSTFAVYSEALATAFGLSALRTSTVLSITTAGLCIAGGVTGVLAARVPLRPVVAAAEVAVAAAVGILQVTTSYLAVVAAFGLVGTAGGTTFVGSTSTRGGRWESRSPPTASGSWCCRRCGSDCSTGSGSGAPSR
jgi:hypothetical protein